MASLPIRAVALHAARCLLDKGCEDVRVMELPDGTAIFDYVVLGTARSDRQANAAVDAVYRLCKHQKIGHLPVEGGNGWSLVDCLDTVVHVMTAENRDRYAIDSLWKQARDLDLDKELKKLEPLPLPPKPHRVRTPRLVDSGPIDADAIDLTALDTVADTDAAEEGGTEDA